MFYCSYDCPQKTHPNLHDCPSLLPPDAFRDRSLFVGRRGKLLVGNLFRPPPPLRWGKKICTPHILKGWNCITFGMAKTSSFHRKTTPKLFMSPLHHDFNFSRPPPFHRGKTPPPSRFVAPPPLPVTSPLLPAPNPHCLYIYLSIFSIYPRVNLTMISHPPFYSSSNRQGSVRHQLWRQRYVIKHGSECEQSSLSVYICVGTGWRLLGERGLSSHASRLHILH